MNTQMKNVLRGSDPVIQKRYKHKKANAADRGISFSLSFEEFSYIYNKATKCDYTGVKFSNRPKDLDYMTIERVDSKLGYCMGNIVLVTKQANDLKNLSIDSDLKSHFNIQEELMLEKINSVLANPIALDMLRMKYIPRNHPLRMQRVQQQASANRSPIMKPTLTTKQAANCDQKSTTEHHSHKDVCVAEAYLALSNAVKKQDVEFNLSFTQFNVKCQRKTCALTRKPLTQPFIYRVNKQKPFDSENTIVTNRVLSNHIQAFLENSGLSITEASHVFKRLNSAN